MGGHRRGYSTLTHASTLGIGSCCAGSQGHATTPMPAASGLVPCKGFPTGEEPLDYSRYSPTTEVALPTETWHGPRAAFALSNRRRRLPPITLHVARLHRAIFKHNTWWLRDLSKATRSTPSSWTCHQPTRWSSPPRTRGIGCRTSNPLLKFGALCVLVHPFREDLRALSCNGLGTCGAARGTAQERAQTPTLCPTQRHGLVLV
jgi:hypothetical protein